MARHRGESTGFVPFASFEAVALRSRSVKALVHSKEGCMVQLSRPRNSSLPDRVPPAPPSKMYLCPFG